LKPIISSNTRIRHPEFFGVGDDSIVDDFCYFSTKVRLGRCSHIASGCSVAGGVAQQFTLGDFSSLSSGVKVWCTSDDFVNDLVTILPQGIGLVKTGLIVGDVTIGDYTAVGSNAVIMPGNTIPTGSVIGALSLVPAGFAMEPWMVYAGVPVRPIRPRNRDNVLAQAEKLNSFLQERQS
jgi:acetyltransferase-like isoleucine patch superfamily enzyme